MIPVYRPYHDDLEMKYLKEVIDSGWWGMGPKTAEFETKFAQGRDRRFEPRPRKKKNGAHGDADGATVERVARGRR